MTSSQHAWLLALAFVAPTLAAQPAAQPAALPGYDADAAQAQRALEARFDSGLKDADYRGWLKQWSSAPNHVGSPHNLENARDLQTRLCSYGWDARIETFEVLWPSPKTSQLELLGAKPYVARLKEPPLPGDSTSSQTENVLPPYVIYGGNGDVTGDPVYVNYGIAEDYEALARNGVDVRGKIVIARYGKGWRGLKPRLAQEHGAIGAIIYSDPRDDGYFQDQAYPDGPARNQWSVQRGSVANFAIYPGDPLTPGVGASKGAKRLKIEQAGSVLKIPTLPISWGDAQPLLAALGGRWHRRTGAAPCRSPTASAGMTPRACTSRSTRSGAARPSTTSSPPYAASSIRTSGWCAAITATAGCSVRPIRSRAPPHCWPKPRQSVSWPSKGSAPSARSSMPAGTAKKPACWAPPNGPNSTPTNCAARRCCTSTPTAMGAAFSMPAAAMRCNAWSTGWRRICATPTAA